MLVDCYGVPRVLFSDNAFEFCSESLKTWSRENGFRLIHLTPYHPQGNSISERMHRTMKAILTALRKGQPSKWPQYIKQCQRIINGAVHETTGEQPYFLMFNRRAPRMVGIELPHMEQDSNLSVAIELVKKTNRAQASRWRNRATRKRKNQRGAVDQLVWVK